MISKFSILPVLFKIYETCMFDQMYGCLNQILFKHQCGFRPGQSTQHNLLLMVEKLKKSLDNTGVGGILLTDISIAFGSLRRDLLITKLAAYDFDQASLCFIFSYISDRTQRTKVSNAYNSYTYTIHDVTKSSILGPLLFDIDICDSFLWD